MSISTTVAFTIDDIGLGAGRVYRVGSNGVVVSDNRVAAFSDDGVVFEVLEFVEAPGGWGRVSPYHIHDNGDGSMNVYFRLTGPDLPLSHRDAYVTLNAETGASMGAIHDLPYSGSDGTGGMGHTDEAGHADGQILQQSLSLADGTIAIVDTSTVLNQFIFKIVNSDGTFVSLSSSLGSGVTSYDSQLLFDLTEVGDRIAVAWTNYVGTGAPAHIRFLNRDGSFASDEISFGNSSSSAFGNTPAIQVETLSDGRLVVVWVENGTDSGPDTDQTSTWFTILNADGTEFVAPTLVNSEVTAAREDTPMLIVTESGFVVGYSALDFRGIQEGRLREYDNGGNLLDTETAAYLWGVDDIVRTDNNTAFIVGGNIHEITLPGADTPLTTNTDGPDLTGTPEADNLIGTSAAETISGLEGDDRLFGEGGDDTILGGDGADTLNGGDGDDVISGGATASDLRDIVYAGSGNDSVDGGYGNDLLFGMDGNDTLAGGFGADELQGQDGDDVITGSAYSDLVYGGAGDDFVNGGFGHDRINGGSGADKFYHVGVLGHGSDWVQDYNAAEGDVLLFGIATATVDDFQVNFSNTDGAGEAGVREAFVIYKPTEQIMWALIDGEAQTSINLKIGGDIFDLLA